jgi:hypothetical protein
MKNPQGKTFSKQDTKKDPLGLLLTVSLQLSRIWGKIIHRILRFLGLKIEDATVTV